MALEAISLSPNQKGIHQGSSPWLVQSLTKTKVTMTKKQLKDYLVSKAEYNRETVDEMSDYELLDAYLNWEGIIGYTSRIISVVKTLDIKSL